MSLLGFTSSITGEFMYVFRHHNFPCSHSNKRHILYKVHPPPPLYLSLSLSFFLLPQCCLAIAFGRPSKSFCPCRGERRKIFIDTQVSVLAVCVFAVCGCVLVCLNPSLLLQVFTTQRPKPSLLAAIVELCRRERERGRRAEAATEIEIVLALDLMKDFYHANSWQQHECGRDGGVAGNCCHFYGSY